MPKISSVNTLLILANNCILQSTGEYQHATRYVYNAIGRQNGSIMVEIKGE